MEKGYQVYFKKIANIISTMFGIDESEIYLKSSFIGDLNFDSLDGVEFIIAIEKEFNITISDEDAEKLRTVGELVYYVQGKTSPIDEKSLKRAVEFLDSHLVTVTVELGPDSEWNYVSNKNSHRTNKTKELFIEEFKKAMGY